MRKFKLLVLFLVSILSFHLVSAQMLSQKKALEDFQQFINQIQKTHPALYQNQTEAEWGKAVKKFEEELMNQKEIGLSDFFWKLNALCLQVKSAETVVDIIVAAEKTFMDKARFFPHRLIFEKGETFVYHSSDSSFLHGFKVHSINGKKMEEINNSHRLAVLEEQFGYYYTMRYGLTTQYELRGIDYFDKKQHTMTHEALTHPYMPQMNIHKGEELLSLIGEEHDIIWIDMFSLKDPHELDSLKEKLKGFETDKVILDMRNFHNDYFEAFWPLVHIFGYEPQSKFYKMDCKEKSSAIRYPSHPMNTIKHDDYKFCILMDGESGELANMVAGMATKHKTAIVAGDESGANELMSQVRPKSYTLKNSGFVFQVPTCNFSLLLEENPLKDRGLLPEHIVHPTWEEIVTEDDGPLNFCKRILTGKLNSEEAEEED